MNTQTEISPAEQTWVAVMSSWFPKYDYERLLIPFVTAIRAVNLDPKKIASVIAMFGREIKYTHDRTQNIMKLPDSAKAAKRKAREVRKEREEALRFPARAKKAHTLHCKISRRLAGSFLERQKQIDYRLLATAHAMPGVSMDENLRCCSHPSAKRLLA